MLFRSLPLVATTDVADLDDMLLVYVVAAQLLARAKQADAEMMQKQAGARLQWVRQNYPTKEERRCLGAENTFKKDRRLTGMTILVK